MTAAGRGGSWPRPWPGRTALPDAIVLTEGTGDAVKGALGIYRGQRGRMQIEVTVTGRSAHGSMPAEGLNPLEFGSAILAEAAARHEQGQGFDDDPFLGRGTRTASWASLDTPSDCAVPARFTFRFDRRLTAGEHPEEARADIEGLAAVAAARAAGLDVAVTVPHYDRPTWRGHEPDNPQIYPGWVTPEDHPAVDRRRRDLRPGGHARRPGTRAGAAACGRRPGSTAGSSPPTASASRCPPARLRCLPARAGSTPATSSTRR